MKLIVALRATATQEAGVTDVSRPEARVVAAPSCLETLALIESRD